MEFPRSSKLTQPPAPPEDEKASAILEQNVSSNMPIAKPPELPKPEEPPPFSGKPTFIPLKPISHSPKISPSSIPNPNPSVTTTKQIEPSFSNYGGYNIYSVPGFSAFQPVAYPGILQPNTTVICQKEPTISDIASFPTSTTETTSIISEKKITEVKMEEQTQNETPEIQSDFEEKFIPEMIPATHKDITHKNLIPESKLNITQAPGGIVMKPSKTSIKEVKKKPFERFSLKTSIPISKIDMKCVTNPSDSSFPNNQSKKPFNPAFHTPDIKENMSKIEIKSNVVIQNPLNESEGKINASIIPTTSSSINTLINAAETINKTELQFKKPDLKPDQANEGNESNFTVPAANLHTQPIFNPINIETSNASVSPNTTDSSLNETKNKFVFLQKNNPSKSKMLLTIQQQNPQVLLQRTNFDPKNLQAPSRPSGQLKKTKEDLLNENGTSSKVVSLKRMHQDNYDENDFENLITENQIYGNKIVVKEKSHATLQEQDSKNKLKNDKLTSTESKNVVIHPNFVYLGNVQFPANLMMIKNSSKVNTDSNKIRAIVNENQHNEIAIPHFKRDPIIKGNKLQDVSTNKEIHILKANNNVLQTLSNRNSKSDLLFQTTNPQVIVNPQIVYQVPMIMDTDNKLNQTLSKGEYPKIISQNKRELQNSFEHTNPSDKLFITCPYQMDSKLKPKIVITNIRPKITKIDEISSLDMYEQRKKLRRLKYLSNRDYKYVPNIDIIKPEIKKASDDFDDIITPEKMNSEIYKEFTNAKVKTKTELNENDSDYEDDIEIYNSLIEEYGDPEKVNKYKGNEYGKVEFLAHFKLASQNDYIERCLQRQEKILRTDAVACAYIAAGRIDCLLQEDYVPIQSKYVTVITKTCSTMGKESDADQQRKRKFLAKLKLKKITPLQKKNYEKIWRQIEQEKKRRENPNTSQLLQQSETQSNIGELDMKDQLEILTEIKKHVNDNHNLIKKRLDSYDEDGESIKVLAEKNFSELNRLSIMADRSVKHFSGQNTRKRDLNPGFDSENIQKSMKATKYYADINIPNISNIISLKSTQTSCIAASAQATSMDEPQNSATGVNEMFNTSFGKVQDFSCQVDTSSCWPGIEVIMKMFKEYETVRKKEIADLHKRNTNLRVESAHITRAASQDSDRTRALLAERRNLANEERTVRSSIQWLTTIIDLVKKYDDT